MKKRTVKIMALISAAAIGLSACGSSNTDTASTVETATAEAPAETPAESAEAPAGEETPEADSEEEYVIEKDPEYNVATEELLKKFPIKYETPANTDLTKKIQNRMLNGFNRWNMGYEAWEHWGEVLYHPESIYNVNGVRMTLKEYQQAMDISLKQMDIRMGNFTNMILVDDWMAIQYDIVNVDKETGEERPGTTMEFAKFGDYGELGAKVDEGWGGTKNESYDGMLNFLTEDEKKAQEAFMQEIVDTKLPDTDNLEEKYPVVYPTTIDTELGEKMKECILKDFEAWNSGYDAWTAWVDEYYTEDVEYDYRGEKYDIEGLKGAMKDMVESSERVRINNILVSEDWAAIHFYDVTAKDDGKKEAANHMQFLHFVEDGDGVKVDMCFAK